MNAIYRGDSQTITVNITGLATLSGYTVVFIVKDDLGDTPLKSNTGSTESLTATFNITSSETDISADNYNYGVVASNGVNVYTVRQYTLTIKDSINRTE